MLLSKSGADREERIEQLLQEREVEEFLYHEAALLDEGRFYEWLELFTDDVRYWMPVRETLKAYPDGLHPEGPPTTAIIDDDKAFLIMRVKRLDTGLAHAESPPSRTRHLITNVRVVARAGDEITVHSNFVLYQGRVERVDYTFYGRREDRLRQVDGQWKIAWRKIVLDQTVLPRALSAFF